LTFEVKLKASDTSPVLSKADGDFDKTVASNGNYQLTFEVDDTKGLKAKSYTSELKTVITADTDVDKSYDIPFIVERAVIADA